MSFQFSYREYAVALYAALAEDAFYIAMERSVTQTASCKDAMLRYLDYSMVEASIYGELHIPKDHQYGVSVWLKPCNSRLQTKKAEDKSAFLLGQMGEKSLHIYDRIVGFMSERSASLVEQDAWYLSIVGILPEFQGRGLGVGLVRPVLKETDRLGISTYLETFTPRNMSFYERLGYKAVGSFYEPTAAADYWLMVRGAGAKLYS